MVQNNKGMNEKIFVTRGQFLGTFAKYAVSQSPYPRPDNLELVIDRLNENVNNWFDNAPMGVAEFDNRQQLENVLATNTELIPEFQAWNDTKNSGNEAELHFVSRYDAPGNPDDDFIDLEALWRNVAVEIERESKL